MTDPDLPEIPARELPLSARAPAKCILFGEHAVVHGKPELLLAMDLYSQVSVRTSTRFSLNADKDPLATNPYLARAVASAWAGGEPLSVQVTSRIPRAAGLGSSAAFVAAVMAILASARGGVSRPDLAQRSFEVEQGAQGVGSPGDTTAVVGGGYLAVNGGSGPLLWEVNDPAHRWQVRRVSDPGWTWVVAYSGVPRNTGLTVKAVGRRLAEADGPRILEEFERVAAEGIAAVAREDRPTVGHLLDRNQELLREVGVSHPRLEELLEAVRPACEGAKLTGAGAGGSIVVLPKVGRELEATRRISRAGGVPIPVRPARRGVELVEPLAPEPPPAGPTEFPE
jgi:mevalonate kinase